MNINVLHDVSILRFIFTNCKNFYNLIFTKTVTADFFSRTPLPVGIGMFFMKQAKNDARLFDTDFYNVIFIRLKNYFSLMKNKLKKTNKPQRFVGVCSVIKGSTPLDFF